MMNEYLSSIMDTEVETLSPESSLSEARALLLRKGLHQQRLEKACEALVQSGATNVLDLGCGEGKLMRLLLREKQFKRIVGTDVSYAELLKAKERLHWEEMSPKQRERVELFQGALTYRDDRLNGFDAAAIVEVIEHLDPARLKALERVVFEFARPRTVVLTTPNAEYNVVYATLSAGAFRHSDHRFEWTRAQFKEWGDAVALRSGYTVAYDSVGEEQEGLGGPSQMAVFSYGA